MTAHTCGEADGAYHDDCPGCMEAMARSLADFNRHGGYNPLNRPLATHERVWRSREQCMEEEDRRDA